VLSGFHVTFRGYFAYDSDPLSAGASNDDDGVTPALVWTF
jgi:hypothetical protein